MSQDARRYLDKFDREVALYWEDDAVAINTIEPTHRQKTGNPLDDNTFHEVLISGEDLDLFIAELTTMRDTIKSNPAQEDQ